MSMKVNKLLKLSGITLASLGLVSLSLTSCSETKDNDNNEDDGNIVVNTPIKQGETLEFDLGFNFYLAFGGVDFPSMQFLSDIQEYAYVPEATYNISNVAFYGMADTSEAENVNDITEISKVNIVVTSDATIGKKTLKGYYFTQEKFDALNNVVFAAVADIPYDDEEAFDNFFATCDVTSYITTFEIEITVVAA